MSSKKSQFDKFMKEIIKKESLKKSAETQPVSEETPQRQHRRLYSERWQNRIRWSKKVNNREK